MAEAVTKYEYEDEPVFLYFPTEDIPICDLQQHLPDLWESKLDAISFFEDYSLTMLVEDDIEYIEALERFRNSCNNNVTCIQRVENPYTWLMYQLKKEAMKHACEMVLYHGTNMTNLDSILRNNFDWRLHGSKVGNKFGKGISFSHLANYSKRYTDCNRHGDNIMIQARVLIGNSSIGTPDTELPAATCDSTVSENERVYVKYHDNEFYPEYVIHFNY